MESYPSKNTSCCDKDGNVIEIDGTHTCEKCGLVLDMLCMENHPIADNYNKPYHFGGLISEYCERGNIDTESRIFAERLFKQFTEKYPKLQKVPLAAACIYVGCKRNRVPRTLKELSGITGCNIKYMAKYEKHIYSTFYPNTPSAYVERFCRKLNLKFEKIKIVLNELERNPTFVEESNAITTACAYI